MFCSKYFKHLQFIIPYPITHNCSMKPAISLLLDSILTSNINATQKVPRGCKKQTLSFGSENSQD